MIPSLVSMQTRTFSALNKPPCIHNSATDMRMKKSSSRIDIDVLLYRGNHYSCALIESYEKTNGYKMFHHKWPHEHGFTVLRAKRLRKRKRTTPFAFHKLKI